MKKLLAITSFILALAACGGTKDADNLGKDGQGNTQVTDCNGKDPSGSFEVNGKEAKEYFSQFVSDSGAGAKSYLENGFEDFKTETDKESPYHIVALYLANDATYTADFSEGLVTKVGSGAYISNEKSKETFKGKWCVRGLNLVVEGLGTGTGMSINKEEKVLFKYSKDVSKIGQSTSGHNVTLHYWKS